MLPTFVIGLREGLEAALIVGFVAAFLKRSGRNDLVRWALLGVLGAVVLCVGVGVALRLYAATLPQRQQEGLETVIGAIAVGMVTYMVVWMRRNSRSLKGQLEGAAADALKAGSGMALVLMAFLAVLREGFETVVFLLAAFNESSSGASAGFGALIGVLVAVALGYGIYRGGVKINLSKFFRATGFVLVLVAAGLVVNALHTAHEAGWLDLGQQQTLDLTALVRPGSVQASLITGMLGIQPRPVLIEVVGWLVYLVPVGLYIVWPPGKGLGRAMRIRVAATGAAVTAAAAIVLALVAPSSVAAAGTTTSGALSAGVGVPAGDSISSTVVGPEGAQSLTLRRTGTDVRDGIDVAVYGFTGDPVTLPARTTTAAAVAALNGGRLPIGITAQSGALRLTRSTTSSVTLSVSAVGRRVIDASWATGSKDVVTTSTGAAFPLDSAAQQVTSFAPADVAAAAGAVQRDRSRLDDAQLLRDVAWVLGAVALVLVVAVLTELRLARRQERPAAEPVREPVAV